MAKAPRVLLIGEKIELTGTGVVTNLTLPSRAVVRFYNQRGTAEKWIKEGKQALYTLRSRKAVIEIPG